EEVSSTAEELASQAQQLQNSMSFFKISESADAGHRQQQENFRPSSAPARSGKRLSRQKAPALPASAGKEGRDGGSLTADFDPGDDEDKWFERY
ncbi:MAG: hypothetical protein ACLFPD_11280, partial [Desulfosudaceae bacterium]